MSRLNQLKEKEFEDIYPLIDYGLDVWRREIPDFSITKNVKNPFLYPDRNPSSRIKQSSSGLWLLNIYNGEGGYYNAVQFIQKKYNLNYKQAIDYIKKDYFLDSKIVKVEKKNPIIKKTPIFYEVEIQPFTKQHKDYFCVKDVTEEFLNNKMDIYSINRYAINKTVYDVNPKQYMFAYIFRDINYNIAPGKMKLLTLGNKVPKEKKWRNNLLPFDFYYTYKIKDEGYTFVVKSNKDCVPFELCGLRAIATMSENKNNIIEGLKPLIDKFPNTQFVSVMGSDKQGTETSIAITKELNLPWFNIPKHLLTNDVNDIWEYYKNFGLNSFKQLLKNKGFL